MAQTPISISQILNTSAVTTLYTVPAASNAVVKTVMVADIVGASTQTTLSKISGGVTYPITINAYTGYTSSTYYPGNPAINLLSGPITLATGESLAISVNGTPQLAVTCALQSSGTQFQNSTPSGTNWYITNINYLNGYYIAVGYDSTNLKGLVLYSSNGASYTQATFTDNVVITDIAYGSGTYIVCNSSTSAGTVHYSTTLSTWTSVALPSFSSGYGMYTAMYGGGNFVIAGAHGYSYYSSNGTTWTKATPFDTADINAVMYYGSNYVYAPQSESYYYTTNFSTYTQPYISFPNQYNGYAYMSVKGTTIFATSSNSPSTSTTYSNVLYSSTNNGTSFSALTENAITSWYGTPALVQSDNAGYLYLLPTYYASSILRCAYSSTGGTSSFTSLSIAALPSGAANVVWSTYGSDIYTSPTYLSTWNAGNGNLEWFRFNSGSVAQQSNGVSSSYASNSTPVISTAPISLQNPFTGTWVMISLYGYLATGATSYGGSYWYGNVVTTALQDGNFSNGWYSPNWTVATPQFAYCGNVIPNTKYFIVGTSTGWLFTIDGTSTGTLSNGYTPYFINSVAIPATPAPSGLVWTSGMGAVVAICRSGDSSGSGLLVVWQNGMTAITTNQGSTWTMGNMGAINAGTPQDTSGNKLLVYCNGFWTFYNQNTALYCVSSNGYTWSSGIYNIQNFYNVNSQTLALSSLSSSSSQIYAFNSLLSSTLQVTGIPYLNTQPSIRTLTYVNSMYYLGWWYSSGYVNGIYYSSTLSGLAGQNVLSFANGTYSFNALYNYPGNGTAGAQALMYSGTGNSFVASEALRSISANAYISLPFNPASLSLASVTAGIIQIS